MQAIQLSHKEQELLEIEKEIRRCEGVINSPNINSVKYKSLHRKELIRLIGERDRLSTEITEGVFLGVATKS
jgi:hypothetical protein